MLFAPRMRAGAAARLIAQAQGERPGAAVRRASRLPARASSSHLKHALFGFSGASPSG